MNPRGMTVTRTVWAVVTGIFLSVMFLSLFHMPVGMDMSGGMSSDCPFMSHEEVICSMSTLDHLTAWKSAFMAALPSLTLLLLAIAAIVLVLSVAPNLLQRQRYRTVLPIRYLTERTYSYSYRPLQELFSNGILHPKLF